MSGLYDKCIVAKDANECATLLEKCMVGSDNECIQTFQALSSEYQKGLRLEDKSKVNYIRSVLEKRGFVFFQSDCFVVEKRGGKK
jgi:hypothetical protein